MQLVSPNFSDLMDANIEIGTFPDGDTHVHIPDIKKYENQSVTLFHRLYPNQNSALMELFFMLTALKNVGAKITLVSPYLPYARQDKAVLEGEVVSAEIVCNMIADAGVKKLITFDCHFLKKEGAFTYGKLPITNISLNKELLAHGKKVCNGEHCEVVAPDQGAAYLVQNSGGKSMQKVRRDYKDEKISYREVEGMDFTFEVEGQNILILDDMISTGSTMIRAIEAMKQGGAKKVYCAATHGFFLHDSLAKLDAISDGVFVTDTILSPVSNVSIKEKLTSLL